MSNALACRKQGKQALVAATIIQKSNMSKHTPGPWRTPKECDYIGDSEGNILASLKFTECTSGNYEPLPWQANARLMAAAPEMKEDLEEAVRLLKHLRYLYDVEMCEDEAYINDFITKAESTLAKIEGDE